MKSFLLALYIGLSLSLQAADDATLAAVMAADDARVAAMKSPDKDKLSAVLSENLHYAHSTGTVDSKEVLMDILLQGKTKYLGYDYVERKFTFPAPGIALMTGQARIQAANDKGQMDNVLSFLGVWREEKGVWRFLAWQSCKLPPANP
jgi:hypothetical protein